MWRNSTSAKRGIGTVPVLAGLLVVGISAFVWLSSQSTGPSAALPASEPAKSGFDGKYALPGARLTGDERAAYKRLATAGVSEAVRQSVFPMNEFTVGRGNEFKLPVWFATKESCMPGDLTALAGDVKRSEKKRILVSLEPLRTDDDVMAPSVQTMTLEQFKRGQRVEFHVKLKHVPAQLGLFVCRDDEGQGRCATKELVNYQRVFGEIEEALGRNQPPAAPDRLYAFQYVMVGADGRAQTFLDSPVAPQSWDILAHQAPTRFSNDTNAVKSIERAREISKALDSAPVSARAGQMVFVLPSRGEKCPTLAQMATGPGGARLRALLDEVSTNRTK